MRHDGQRPTKEHKERSFESRKVPRERRSNPEHSTYFKHHTHERSQHTSTVVRIVAEVLSQLLPPVIPSGVVIRDGVDALTGLRWRDIEFRSFGEFQREGRGCRNGRAILLACEVVSAQVGAAHPSALLSATTPSPLTFSIPIAPYHQSHQ